MSEYSDKIDALPPEYVAKWEALCDGMTALIGEVFDLEADHPAVVFGVQFGVMGHDHDGGEKMPNCLASSNLPLCYGPMAAQDAMEFLEEQHEEFHEQGGANGVITEPMVPEAVPEEIRARAEAYAEKMGLSVDQIQYVAVGEALDIPDSPEDEQA